MRMGGGNIYMGMEYLQLQQVRLQPLQLWENKFLNGDKFLFIFIEGGVAKYVSSAAIQRLAAGSALVCSGQSAVKLQADEKSGCTFACFSTHFEQLFSIFSSVELSLLPSIADVFRRGKVYPTNAPFLAGCRQLLEAAQNLQKLEHRSRLLCVIAAILGSEFKAAQNHHKGLNSSEDRMIQAFEKLSAEELLTLSVDELAMKFNCSRRHLNRLFHQHFRLSIISLKMELRLLKAASLLMDSQAKIIHVAEKSGFHHLGLFNTCFKRRYGTSPGLWRKQMLLAGKRQPTSQGKGSSTLLATNLPWGTIEMAENFTKIVMPSGNAATLSPG
jgi:AraC-like DNA-binding protein